MNYRPDIDGLRSIAVLFVIFFHYEITSLSGGFVGVDVFFVLSGYLIGSIIFNALEANRFSFVNFYTRRARRLFPALIVVILATSLFAYLWMLPVDFREFGQSLFASTIYISNILFYLESGYFDSASHLKPLLHTWSLSVEEQFYLIFPLIAWLTYKLNKTILFVVFASLSLISFLSSIYYIEIDTSAVFYLFPFRAWEMLLGVILAIKFIPTINSNTINTVLSILGLALIVITGFSYNSATLFPGLAALAPTVGTALLIYSGEHNKNLIHKFLSTSVPVFIGKLSYSLYLWHWPVYVLYSYKKADPLSLTETSGLLAVVFLLSYLTWKFIETPFRKGLFWPVNSTKGIISGTIVISSFLLAFGYYIHITKGVPQRLDFKQREIAQAASALYENLGNCKDHDNSTLPGIKHCESGGFKEGSSFTLLWGDSHSAAIKPGYNRATDSAATLHVWKGGCPPVFGIEVDESVSSRKSDELCYLQNGKVKQLIYNQQEKINKIILIGRWSYYLNGSGLGVDSSNKISIWEHANPARDDTNQSKVFLNALKKTLEDLAKTGIEIYVVQQPPEFKSFNARKLAINLVSGEVVLDDYMGVHGYEEYRNVLNRQKGINSLFEELENKRIIHLIRTHEKFCTDLECYASIDGTPAYFDNNHLSPIGAKSIYTIFLSTSNNENN